MYYILILPGQVTPELLTKLFHFSLVACFPAFALLDIINALGLLLTSIPTIFKWVPLSSIIVMHVLIHVYINGWQPLPGTQNFICFNSNIRVSFSSQIRRRSPAASAGVKEGDVVLEINKLSTNGMSHLRAVQVLESTFYILTIRVGR